MDFVVEFQYQDLDPRITHLFLYRRRGGTSVRIPPDPDDLDVIISPGTQYWAIRDAAIGDEYWYTFFDNAARVESGPSPALIAREAGLLSSIITGYVGLPSGLPSVSGIPVKATLYSPGIKPSTVDGEHLASSASTETGADGSWTLELVPNDKIRPLGSYWRITYLGRTYYKAINSTKGASQNFAALHDVLPVEAR